MGETGFHVLAIVHLLTALRYLLRARTDVYVIGDMFLYYKKGNPRAVKAPDVMVIKGVDNHERRTFKLWEEAAAPCVVFEITSRSTMVEDLTKKTALYAKLGVREYFIFDPLREYLAPQLVGFRLSGRGYEPLPPNDKGWLHSEECGAWLAAETHLLRVIDPATGKPIPRLDEAMQIAEYEAQRAEREAQRAENETQRAEQEMQRAIQEAERAVQEAERAVRETRRADAAEAEVARLRALLAEKHGQ